MLSSKEEKDGRHSILEVVPGTASRSILNEIVPKVDIISYQALMPRMNDIFIKLVKDSGGAVSQGITEYQKNTAAAAPRSTSATNTAASKNKEE